MIGCFRPYATIWPAEPALDKTIVGVELAIEYTSMFSILKRDRDDSEEPVEIRKTATDHKVNEQKEKVVSPPTKEQLQELKQEYIVQCTKVSRGDT